MAIELKDGEVRKFWAWIVAHEEPHDLLACFHEGTDDLIHLQWRLATREHPGQSAKERKKTFHHATRELAENDGEMRTAIAQFAQFVSTMMNCGEATVIAVEGDTDKALEMLEAHAPEGVVELYPIH